MVATAHPQPALTTKQEAFARFIAGGKGRSESYRLAYNAAKMGAGSVSSEAFKLMCNPAISNKIRELMERADANLVLTRTRKRHLLFEIAESKRNKAAERIKAIEVDNRMTGDEAPVKIEGELSLLGVLGSIKQVQPIIELQQEPTEFITLQGEGESDQDAAAVVAKADSLLPAIPLDSGPFDAEVGVHVPVNAASPQKLTRTRSYDE